MILLEIVIFAWVADHIGLGLTLLALISSAAAGLWLIHHTGLEMVGRLRLALAQGQEPGHSLVDGACFVIAGMFLILPGFFTDLLALVLILPVSRNWLIRRFASAFGTPMAAAGAKGGKAGSPIITDVEFREVREDDPAPGPDEPAGEPAGAARPPKAEPQILVPAKAERAAGAAIRPGVIDVETETEQAAGKDAGEKEGGAAAEDAAAENTAAPDDAAGKAPQREQPAGNPEEKNPGENLGVAPRRPIIDVEED
ncbi:MAG TPA: FxsA family protein [Dongiaceae bacterium]|nr:FxsA family protein [Dongiaceae bacterium]